MKELEKILTSDLVQKELNKYNIGFKLFLYVLIMPFLIFSIVFFIIIGIAIDSAVLFVISAIILLIGLFILFVFCKISKTRNKQLYYIIKDTCIKKEQVDYGVGESNEYFLHFKNTGKYRINSASTSQNSLWALFRSTKEGDDFFLVMTTKNKIRFLYNTKEWKIDKNSFRQKDNVFLLL